MEYAIEIDSLSYNYKSQWLLKSKPAVSNLSLKIPAGTSFGFLGGNGAGKTTTIKALLGLIKPDKGNCRLFGKDSSDPSARKQVGFVAERPYFYDNLTVLELMNLYAKLVELKSISKEQIKAALSRVSIDHKMDSKLKNLSKGQTQRVAMAQAILGEPKLLILDEPMSGLDPNGRREFRDLFLELKHKGVTIFMSSHILSDVESICQQVSIMKAGVLQEVFDLSASGYTQTNSYEISFTNFENCLEAMQAKFERTTIVNNRLNIKLNSREDVDSALVIAEEASAKLESLVPIRENLEQLFIKLTK